MEDVGVILTVVNMVMTLAIGGMGWILNSLSKSITSLKGDIDKLKDEDKKLSRDVSEIHILVAGEYVKKDEMQGIVDRLFVKLDAIDQKLDRKVDREEVQFLKGD